MPQPQRTQSPHSGDDPSPGQKPVDKFTDGRVHVSIWEHDGANGAFRKASFQLRYRDSNQEWQTGTSYTASDLSHLEDAAREARQRIKEWQRKNGPRQSRSAAP